MIENAIDNIVNDFANRLQAQGLDLGTYLKYTGMEMDKFREGYKENAEAQVKLQLALEAIIKAENIEATDEEAEKKYMDSMPEPEDGNEKLKPDDRNTRILLANVLTALNNYDQALPYLQELSRDPQLLASAGMQGIFGNYYFRKRNFRAANQAFTAAYNQSPRDPLTIYNAAVSRDFYYNRDQGLGGFLDEARDTAALLDPYAAFVPEVPISIPIR